MGKYRRGHIPKALTRAFREINQERGRKLRERGSTNEWRVFEAFEYPAWRYGFPEWFCFLRVCTRDEDGHGIDAVIETTDVGKILLQIKSSYAHAKRFSERRRRGDIAIIVVRQEMTPEDIRTEVLRLVSEKRNKILTVREETPQGVTAGTPS